MKVEFYTRRGEFVAAAQIPEFETTPEVIVWGDRMFTLPIEWTDLDLINPSTQPDPNHDPNYYCDHESTAYIEAFSYIIPQS